MYSNDGDKMAIRLAYDMTELSVSNGISHTEDDVIAICLRYDDDSGWCTVCCSVSPQKAEVSGLYQCRHCHRIASTVLRDSGLIDCRFSQTLNAVWSLS